MNQGKSCEEPPNNCSEPEKEKLGRRGSIKYVFMKEDALESGLEEKVFQAKEAA